MVCACNLPSQGGHREQVVLAAPTEPWLYPRDYHAAVWIALNGNG